MLSWRAVFSSWAKVMPPSALIAWKPSVPSVPPPDRMTPTERFFWISAIRAFRGPDFNSRTQLMGVSPSAGGPSIAISVSILWDSSERPEDQLVLFFEITPTSQGKGREFLQRCAAREDDRDRRPGAEVRDAQFDAITEWGITEPSRLGRLAGITQPVLIAAGDNDIMIPTENAWLMARHLPDARVRIYPDSGHGFLFQWPEQFAALVHSFLSGPGEDRAG